jgi:hypothetical protein
MRALSSILRLYGLDERGVRERIRNAGAGAGAGGLRTHEGADPVPGPISEHWFAVFAAGDEEICPIVLKK